MLDLFGMASHINLRDFHLFSAMCKRPRGKDHDEKDDE